MNNTANQEDLREIGLKKTIKLLVIGESNVGKTSMLRRFVDNKFDFNAKATVGNSINANT